MDFTTEIVRVCEVVVAPHPDAADADDRDDLIVLEVVQYPDIIVER